MPRNQNSPSVWFNKLMICYKQLQIYKKNGQQETFFKKK